MLWLCNHPILLVKMACDHSFQHPADKKHKNTITANQWVSLFTLGILMVLICCTFTSISTHVVLPYIHDTYGMVSEVMSHENIVLTVIMIVFIFLVPALTYLLIARNRPFPKAERYFNGAGTEDQVGFIDSFGKEKKEFLTNWYMEDIFSARLMYKPSVAVSIVLIIAFMATAIITGGGI